MTSVMRTVQKGLGHQSLNSTLMGVFINGKACLKSSENSPINSAPTSLTKGPGVLIINKPFKDSPFLAGFPSTPTHYNTVCGVVEKLPPGD